MSDEKNIKIPKPIFTNGYPMNFHNFCCGCSEPKEKTDCYFYTEVQEMGGRVPTCNYHTKLGYCPCENCDKYIKRSEVYKIVKKYVEEKSGGVENGL